MSANKTISPQASARIQRWSLTLSMYQYSLKFKSSLENGNADALSRLPLVTVPDDPPLPSETILLFNKLEHAPLSADHHHVTSHCISKYAWVSIPKECHANAGFAYTESAFSLHTIRMHWKC